LPKPSSDLPESGPGRSLLSVWSCSGWGLHSPSRYRDGGSLLHCHSTLTRRGLLRKTSEDCLQSSGHIAYNPSGRYYFCCTGLGVASTGCYPASCPVVVSYTAIPPSLSSTLSSLFSVALALESPPPDVIRHPALWSPDFPHLHPFVCAAAIIYSTYPVFICQSLLCGECPYFGHSPV